MSEPINVLLPELVVRPRGSYITYTGKETNRPSVADFIKSKAQEARVNMSLHTCPRGILTEHLNKSGNAATIGGTRMIIYNEDGPQLSAKLSHELEHLLHYPKEAIPDKMLTPRVKRIHGDRYTKFNNTEYSALGSQIHDYYGHTGNEAITPSMLKFARNNYERDTGIRNGMSEMLHNNLDLDFLAKWMTRYSSGVAVPMGMGFYELNNKE